MEEIFMRRSLSIATNGLGRVAPNPLVGSVIVHENKIIGEGFHTHYGGDHAEVMAINAVINKELLSSSTLYVTLEPCCHFGNTPPCADYIIKHKIPNVVIGCFDSNKVVAGKGVEKLKKAGILVKTEVLNEECRALNKRFFTFHEQKRPFIILKWAQTMDGFIDQERSSSQPEINFISNLLSRTLVHKWRSEEQAIMIGTNTAMKDNPQLNVRLTYGKNPTRILIDKNLKIPSHYNLFDNNIPTIVFTEKLHGVQKENITYVPIEFKEGLELSILKVLYEKNIQSVIVEGGAILLNSFIQQDLWDEARVFIGNSIFLNGIKAPILPQKPYEISEIQNDKLLLYRNQK